ncbi:MAG TPA: hypothetical protein VGS20_10930 [Candidatus Acidoferrales bacterium]|nr:hypothetical protein [Candidatus Acidoferrales bacterium]
MSKKHKDRAPGENSPYHDKRPPDEAGGEASVVNPAKAQPNPYTQDRNSREQEYWNKQIQQAKGLNLISGMATGIAFLALIGLVCNAVLIHQQIGQMQQANAISAGTFAATERPWLSVQVTPAPPGLSFVNREQAVLPIKVSVKNVGRSIAKDVQVDAKLFPSPPGLPVATDAAVNQGRLCDHPQPATIGWFSLFPTDPPAEPTLDISAIPAAIASQAVAVPGAKPRRFVGLYVVGCVTYRPSFGPEIYQTRFAYHVEGPPIMTTGHRPLMLPNGMPLMMGGFEIGIGLPQKKLGLMRELFASNDSY